MGKQDQVSLRQERMNEFLAKLQMGDFTNAVKLGTKLVSKIKNDSSLLNYLGIAHAQLGQFEKAAQRFALASRITPDFAWAHNNLGSAYRNLGRLDDAVDAINAALAIQPDYAEAHNNLGNVMVDREEFDAALNAYKAAISANISYSRAHLNLCEVLEKTNRLDAFATAISAAKDNCPSDDPRLLLHLGKLASRQKDWEGARDHLLKIELDNSPLEISIPASEQLGKTYDRLGDYDSAFSSFLAMNNRVIAALDKGDSLTKALTDKLSDLNKFWEGTDNVPMAPIPCNQKISFLIGFPRSGTTLLDTILRGHPDIIVIEEKHILGDLITRFKIDETPDALSRMTNDDIKTLRTSYLELIAAEADTDISGKLVVDKFPLNIQHAGLIKCLFPEAKIIFALRDPADCVLSCFMQNFTLNTAMASFLSIEQAGATYDAVMDLWTNYEARLDLNTHYLKYEDLVSDLPRTIKPLLAFLNMPWVESMSDYQKTATQRKNINTPSYDQVTQPLYSQAKQRWRRYESHLAPILPLMRKWSAHWQYPD